jgi:hypothetical protein
MTEDTVSPGDIVVAGKETGVVWSVSPSALIVLPARAARGALKSWDVSLGVIPLATIKGPTLVSINDRAEWNARDCIKVGRMTAEQSNAVRFAIKRTQENSRIEANNSASPLFRACQPSFRSGGRRVGGARVGV